MLISVGVGFATAAIPPIVNSEILPFGLPLHGVFISLGAGFAAFLATAALSGRAGVVDNKQNPWVGMRLPRDGVIRLSLCCVRPKRSLRARTL
jgi:hypothetical protein